MLSGPSFTFGQKLPRCRWNRPPCRTHNRKHEVSNKANPTALACAVGSPELGGREAEQPLRQFVGKWPLFLTLIA